MIDLSRWKLTLPVNSKGEVSGSGDAAEVTDLVKYANPPFFVVEFEGALTFMAPTDGARTGGSKYPRCELRQMKNGDEFEWTVEQGGRLDASLKINELPLTADGKPGRVVIGQIHGPDDELCRLYYDNGRIYFYDDKAGSTPKETQFVLKDSSGKEPSIGLGERFSYSIIATKLALTVVVTTASGTFTATDPISKFWPGKKLYFKAGVYVQVSKPGSGAGTVGSGRGAATFFDIVLDGAVQPPKPSEPIPAQPVDGLRFNGKKVVGSRLMIEHTLEGGEKVSLPA